MDSADEARQLVRLLWRDRLPPAGSRRGPQQRVSVDAVVMAAVALADSSGLAALSMRSLAAQLGMRPMSVYTYVPSRDVLVALMVDQVATEDAPFGDVLTLADGVMVIGDSLRTQYRRHAWLLDAPGWRDVLGPGRLARYERQLEVLEYAPLTDVERDRLIGAVTSLATGNARQVRDAGGASAASGLSDAQWWEVVQPELAAVLGPAEFPLAGRVGSVVGELYEAPGDPDGQFEFSMGMLVTAIERLVTERGGA